MMSRSRYTANFSRAAALALVLTIVFQALPCRLQIITSAADSSRQGHAFFESLDVCGDEGAPGVSSAGELALCTVVLSLPPHLCGSLGQPPADEAPPPLRSTRVFRPPRLTPST